MLTKKFCSSVEIQADTFVPVSISRNVDIDVIFRLNFSSRLSKSSKLVHMKLEASGTRPKIGAITATTARMIGAVVEVSDLRDLLGCNELRDVRLLCRLYLIDMQIITKNLKKLTRKIKLAFTLA
jgi:hypothetical protein